MFGAKRSSAETLLRDRTLSLSSTRNGTITTLTDSSSDEDDSIPFIDSLALRIDSISWLRWLVPLITCFASRKDETTPKVMHGWLTIYTSDDPESSFTKTSARTQVLTTIRQLVSKYENEDVSIIQTGHSLGASLSILSAFDLATSGEQSIQ